MTNLKKVKKAMFASLKNLTRYLWSFLTFPE